eukprot:CAMPEP_0178420754 /NCGR_PEP_ID=MMETSP0689_2-20121128/26294_1 /TAXON_ID=160604 /ORGANISM="Amphidinium massartii, Strain CS-259" /LENGTH=128 /DNA_ID=CAMNT_0020042243 /DNA_START=76 /DNA_END=462 /DNA_ORIENTATION=-
MTGQPSLDVCVWDVDEPSNSFRMGQLRVRADDEMSVNSDATSFTSQSSGSSPRSCLRSRASRDSLCSVRSVSKSLEGDVHVQFRVGFRDEVGQSIEDVRFYKPDGSSKGNLHPPQGLGEAVDLIAIFV